ncbi:glycoside hydrolase family 2 protein [Phaeacidiphilus oryzae]|uniref:glycoside hydrolase family 2 protein n=1 Tax=Phaeacidiphilus oryzae TaxID=348818 RepID=UPI00068AE5BA|nr:sugar-binding domain-containing protein [Phaeacidiphilus oryzae]
MRTDDDGVLDDGWELRGCLGDTWRWLCGPDRPAGEPGWFPARVPGSVLDDLRRAGEVPDPYTGTGSLLAEWVPQRAWVHRRPLRLPALGAGQRALLRFEGVDHEATVLVDGHELAHHEGMFVPFEVDVSRYADGGEHLLAVVVYPAPANEPQVGRTDRVRVHKARMNYGWDFCPRMVHQGIWQPVRLEVAGPVRLRDAVVGARPDEDGRRGTITVEAALEAAEPGELRIAVRAPDGAAVASAVLPFSPTRGRLSVELAVPEPELWWPNGHGRQPLYTVETGVVDRDGRRSGRPVVRSTGFRRVRLVANPGAPADALPYTLEVNGRRLYAKGWNWVPQDALYGVPRPERLDHLLGLAAEAGVNLLRVWGGGLIETEEFYRRCDRLGLLVWQEFSLSSSGIDSVPAEDAGYLDLMEREARTIVPALRHHPALAVWGPGNELHHTATATPLDESSSPVIDRLARTVAALDPDRCWLPGSPSGGDFLNIRENLAAAPERQHDVHGPWEHQGLGAHQELYDAGNCLLHSEFGVEGMANRRTWEAVVPAGRGWPTGRDNPLMEHLGAWWNNTPLVAEVFGGRLDGVDLMRRASQQLQYDGLRYAVEANLRRAPRSGGAIPWQFNEPFPNAWCTAAVDHRGDPKPAYHGVRRAYRENHVCAGFGTQAWAGRDRFEARVRCWGPAVDEGGGRAVARVVALDGTVVAESRTGVLAMPVAELPGPLFLLDLELRSADGVSVAANRYVHSAGPDLAGYLDLPPAEIAAEWSADRGVLRLAHTGGPAALGLYLTDARPIGAPGWAVFGDNMLDLLPGESVEVPVAWRNAPDEGRAVLLEGWNTDARLLD